MARPSTWIQVSAQRLQRRRTEHALVRRDVALHDDPLRAQSLSLAAGAVVTGVVVAGCAVLGYLKPVAALGDSPIAVTRESGAVWVRVGDVWHPTPNLASARLVARTPAVPDVVDERVFGAVTRGATVGIVGAPAALGNPGGWRTWAVCDAEETVVVAGPSPVDDLPAAGILVAPRGEGPASTYLLHDGVRARIDLRDAGVVMALRLEETVPQPVSRALLDALPEAEPVDRTIAAGLRVTDRSMGADTVCVRWDVERRTATVVSGRRTPMPSVPLAQADGAGPRVDRVALPAGGRGYVGSVLAVTGGDVDGPRHLVTDAGVVFGIRDDAAAAALGLTEAATAVPWPMLAWLPRGPELGIAEASITGDGVAPP
jgi:hypothetical protein